MIKIINKIFLLGLITIIVSCQSEQEKEKSIADAKVKIDSLFSAANKSASIKGVDSTLSDSNFDITTTSNYRVSFDKNEVSWNTEEKNEFRFVHKKKQNKLIVYKNNIEFKVYQNPKIYTYTHTEQNGKGGTASGIKMIYVNEKKIIEYNINTLQYAPNGLEKYSGYYVLGLIEGSEFWN